MGLDPSGHLVVWVARVVLVGLALVEEGLDLELQLPLQAAPPPRNWPRGATT